MTQITVSQYVDVDVDLDDCNADDLAKALIKKKDYSKALDKALGAKQTNDASYEDCEDCEDCEDYDDLKSLIEAFKLNKPIDHMLASIAYKKYGMVM